jgi:hypothetical protein
LADERTDIFALGGMLFRMLVGRPATGVRRGQRRRELSVAKLAGELRLELEMPLLEGTVEGWLRGRAGLLSASLRRRGILNRETEDSSRRPT